MAGFSAPHESSRGGPRGCAAPSRRSAVSPNLREYGSFRLPGLVRSGTLKASLLFFCCILAALPSFGRQRDFTSQAAGRLRLALEKQSPEAMERLSEPGRVAVPEDFFDRYEGFDVSTGREYAIQQFGFVRGGGRYLTAVFVKTEVEPGAYRWVLVDAFRGPARRLGADEIDDAVERARRSDTGYDGFNPLAHDARFLDFSMAVNARDDRLLSFLKEHGVADFGRRPIAPLDHHSFFVIDGVRALRREGSPVALRFVWAYLPSGEGRVTSGWFLRDVRERPEAVATAATGERQATGAGARAGTVASTEAGEDEASCCAEAERLRALWAEERAEREKVEAENERLVSDGERLRAERERAEAERRAVAARIDSLEAANRSLWAERERMRAEAGAASEKSNLVAGAYALLPGGGQFYKGNFRRGVTYASIITGSFLLTALIQRGVDGADELFRLRRAKVQQINATLRTCDGCTARDRERMIAQRDRLIVKRDEAKATRSNRRSWRNLTLAAGVTTVVVSILDSIELDRKIGERFFHRSYLASGASYRVAFPRFGLDPRGGAASVRLTVRW